MSGLPATLIRLVLSTSPGASDPSAAPPPPAALVHPAGPPASTSAEGAWNAYKGTIVVSEVPIASDGHASDAAFVSALRRLNRTTLDDGRDGSWRLHFLAFLKQPAGGEKLEISIYDVATKGDRRRVHQAEIGVHPADRTLAVRDFVVSPDLGFLPGGRYEIIVGRTASGKEDVYARSTLSLR